MSSSVLERSVSGDCTDREDVRGGEYLRCDAVDVDAELGTIRVGVEVVPTEDDVRFDCGNETRGGNNRPA